MKRIAAAGFVIALSVVAVFAFADGAPSKDDLPKLYREYFAAKDKVKLNTLVYWAGVPQSGHESFARSLDFDLGYKLIKVEIVPLAHGEVLEYTDKGVTYRPSLTPIGHMVATYQGQGTTSNLSTSYLVGTKDGRYYITFAAPVDAAR